MPSVYRLLKALKQDKKKKWPIIEKNGQKKVIIHLKKKRQKSHKKEREKSLKKSIQR